MADRPIEGVVLRARVSHAGVKGERSLLALAIVKASRRRDTPDSFSNLSINTFVFPDIQKSGETVKFEKSVGQKRAGKH